MLAAALCLLAGSSAAAATLPFTETFNNGLGEDWTIVDGNDDGVTWEAYGYSGYSSSACVKFTGTSVADGEVANDWLISPEFEMQAGYVYEISFYGKSYSWGKTNSIEVFAGNGASVEAMTIKIGSKEFTYGYSFSEYKIKYTAPVSGSYNIGIKVVGEENLGVFYFDQFTVSDGVNSSTPEAPSIPYTAALEVVNDKIKATFKVTMPTKNFGGTDFAEDEELILHVSRADELAFPDATVAPGEEYEFVDTDALSTSTEYTFTVSNVAGTSAEVKQYARPYFSKPADVTGLVVNQNGNVFQISWDAVTTGSSKNDLFIPSKVTYSVTCATTDLKIRADVATDISANECSYTFPMPENGQEVITFSVTAKNSQGTTTAKKSDTFTVGNPYTGAFAESFANRDFTTRTWAKEGNYSAWSIQSTSTDPVCNPQDDDMGMLRLYMYYSGTLVSPLLDLSTLNQPVLKFWIYQDKTSENDNTIQPGFRVDGNDIMLGEPILMSGTDEDVAGWKELSYIVPDSALQETCQLIFNGVHNTSYLNMYIDNVTIRDYEDNSLAVSSVTVPSKANVGDAFDIVAKIKNDGMLEANAYTVEFSVNGNIIGSVDGVAVGGQKSVNIAYPFTVKPCYAGTTIEISAEVIYNLDADQTDNVVTAEVVVKANELPVASSVSGTVEDNKVKLQWTHADVPETNWYGSVTTDFENWTAYTTEAKNGWIFVDDDNSYQSAFNGNGSGNFAAIVIENYDSGYSSFECHSGEHALAMTKLTSSYSTQNDWIISPEVKGGELVEFYAWAFYTMSSTYTDSFDVLYSTGETETTKFEKIKTISIAKSSKWEKFSFELPDDAKRFAIHFNGKMQNSALIFDDFTYTAESEPLEHTGYNVYRDDELIGSTDSETNSFVDENPISGVQHNYTVSTTYTSGESHASEPYTVKITSTGLENVNADSAAPVEYYNLQGVRVAEPTAGVYIRRQGNTTRKVVVK